jgi:hypothetical protein
LFAFDFSFVMKCFNGTTRGKRTNGAYLCIQIYRIFLLRPRRDPNDKDKRISAGRGVTLEVQVAEEIAQQCLLMEMKSINKLWNFLDEISTFTSVSCLR